MKVLQPYLAQFQPHLDALTQRYQQLGQREQRMLQLLCVVVPCFLFVVFYWQPMQQQIQQLQQKEIQLEKDLAEAKTLATHLQRKSQQAVQIQGSFMAQVEQLAKKAAVRAQIVHLKPHTAMDGSKRMQIRFQDVSYAGVMTFLHSLADTGFSVERVSLDALEKKAYVNVNLWVMQP